MKFRKTMFPASMTIRIGRRSFTLCLDAPIANSPARKRLSRTSRHCKRSQGIEGQQGLKLAAVFPEKTRLVYMKKPQSHSWLVLIALLVCAFPILLCSVAAKQTTKPKLKVAADGLPSGHDTPEGAACDLARSFINRDQRLFSDTSIRLYAGGNGPGPYAKFLQENIQSINLF